MSNESTWDVQSALFARLSTDVTLIALLAEGAQSVKDYVRPDSLFPYMVIGEAHTKPIECGATEVTVTIHSYSKASGMNELRQIVKAIYQCLHNADFTVPNNRLVSCLEQYAETKLESDGKTRHGIQQFQIITESEA